MIMQKNNKDCLVCCLSDLLSIPYDAIPKFYEIYPDIFVGSSKEDDVVFRREYDNWLLKVGYYRITIDVFYDRVNGSIKTPYYSKLNYKCIAILEKKYRKYSHAVIMEVIDNEIYITDPKEKSDYTISDITQIEILVKT